MGPQCSEQNQSMVNNDKAFMWSYFCTYAQCCSENFLLWMGEKEGGEGVERSEHVPRVIYETLKQWKLLNSVVQIKMVANSYGRL